MSTTTETLSKNKSDLKKLAANLKAKRKGKGNKFYQFDSLAIIVNNNSEKKSRFVNLDCIFCHLLPGYIRT